jgi:peptide/nickel transport system ATP-binding protein
MERNGTLLSVHDLRKYFPVRGGLLHTVQAEVKAVDGVSFDVQRGEILGIVGESGCGKSTTARLLLRLIEPDAGEVYFEGLNILKAFTAGMKVYRRQVQMVFQDPYSSLNPRMNIEDAVAFNALVHGAPRREARAKAWDVLNKVRLRAEQFGRRYPHEISGGQRQRVNIARALVLDPKLVLLDEPVSSLDKSVQAQVLNLLQTLKHDLGLTYVFISHDLHVIEYLSDRVLVMYLGQIVEIGSAEEVSAEPDQSSLRMPLSHPLPLCQARVLSGGASPEGRLLRAQGCLPPVYLKSGLARGICRPLLSYRLCKATIMFPRVVCGRGSSQPDRDVSIAAV